MEIKRSVLVPFPAEEMFDLIEQAEDYPLFLPWCVSSRILERSDGWVAARIDFKYLQVRFGFQTRNPKQRPDWLKVRMVEGPFRRFEADWHLTPLGDAGCRIRFDLSYEVSDGLLDRVAARAVDIVSRSMMDAFVKRAEETLVPMAERPAPAQPVAEPAPVEAVSVEPFKLSSLAAPSAPAESAEPAPAQPASSIAFHAPAAAPLPQPAEPPTTETTMTHAEPTVIEAVRACPLSRELSPEQSAVLASLMTMQTFGPGEVVSPEGAADNRLCVLVEGMLSVIKQKGTPEENLIQNLNPGDFAHELGFLDGSRRYASLVASGASRVLFLERSALESLIDSQPLILYRVMCSIVRTVHRIQTRLAVQSSELTNYIVKQHGRY